MGRTLSNPEDVLRRGQFRLDDPLLSALASTAPGAVIFTGDASIRSRPQKPYIEALNRWGIEVVVHAWRRTPPLVIKHCDPGTLRSYVEVDGLISPWTTGLILLAPFTGREAKVAVTGTVQESTYVAMTIEMMKQFGVRRPGGFGPQGLSVPGNQRYNSNHGDPW